ncbi:MULTISPECIES: DUF3102 domain-containing protein [unclassified Xanthobacter]|uniref:DUF3102 domain-containing protein n=1 Tax=unclassified Xanthobacter TaxID=2623496 RepID=UPI001F3B2641|nr:MULTISPECIES: DUF3102 domain-containing protein [unclassified Xanthobacter]
MMNTTTDTVTTATLAPCVTPMVEMNTLPEAINAAHEAVKEAGKMTLLKAKEAGELLLQAKAECAHGEFKAWIEKNCVFSYDRAMRYMRVAKLSGKVGEVPNFECGIDAFLDAHATHRDKAPSQTTNAAKAKPSTENAGNSVKVSELKAEIGRLAGELQAARDALATAEAYIETLKGQSPVASLLAQETSEPPKGPATRDEELSTLRQDVADLTEMLDTSEADRKALKEEVSELKRQLRKATEASPLAEAATRKKSSGPMVDDDGYVMKNEWDF